MGKEMDGLFALGARGAVHSVFDSAFNIRLDTGRLVTVLASGRSLAPYGLVLSEKVRFDRPGLSPGDKAALKPGQLTAGALTACITAGTARVRLSPAGFKSGAVFDYGKRLRILAAALDCPEAREGIAPILCALAPDKIPFAMEQNVYTRFLAGRARVLTRLTLNGDMTGLAAAGAGLAGCGPGLTPSSDDFLCGFMAAISGGGAAGLLPPRRAAEICRALAEGAAPKTADIPAGFLNSAGEGLFSADILAVLRAFFTDGGDELESAAKTLTEFGSTSGFDTLTGIWFGLSAAGGASGQ